MRRLAVLLRGVNLGGRTVLPMVDLRAFLAGLGYVDVRTLLASGNAIVVTDEAAETVEGRIEAASEAGLGRALTALTRDAAALDALVAADPLPAATRERPNQVQVLFFRDAVDAALLDRLVERHAGPETVRAAGHELVVDYAGGLARSTLADSMRRLRFPAITTARNWNTVLKLRDALAA